MKKVGRRLVPVSNRKYPRTRALGLLAYGGFYVPNSEMDRVMGKDGTLRRAFNDAFGVQTGAIVHGRCCVYAHDVERCLEGLPPLD